MQGNILIKGLKRWWKVGVYIIFIFLTTPWLPEVVETTALWLGLSTDQFVVYLKFFTLSGLTGFLLLYLYLSGRYKNKGSWLVLLSMGVVISILAANFGSPAEATHLLEYGGLSILIFHTLNKESSPLINSERRLYSQAALITLLIGIADELYQGYLPNRYYDPNDILTNAVSGTLGLFFIWGVVNPQGEDPDTPPLDTTG